MKYTVQEKRKSCFRIHPIRDIISKICNYENKMMAGTLQLEEFQYIISKNCTYENKIKAVTLIKRNCVWLRWSNSEGQETLCVVAIIAMVEITLPKGRISWLVAEPVKRGNGCCNVLVEIYR